MFTLTAEQVDRIHDRVLNPGELPGRALDKSLESALARIENRLVYGMVGDVFDLAALYAVVISTGHCFNDANKRTAFRAMEVCLIANGYRLSWKTEEIGDLVIRVAQGKVHEDQLADWLRAKAG